jgi:hypothetical protein
VSFFDQPARVTRFKLGHAVWRRQRMDLLLARTGITVVGLTDVRGWTASRSRRAAALWGAVR